MEILRQLREPIDAIFVAVGGGGLIGGIAAYVKRAAPRDPHHRRRAGRRERDGALARARAAASRSRTSASSPTASRSSRSGEETFRLARKLRRRDDARRHRRDLRRDQGRVRGHARDPRAVGGARRRRRQALRRSASGVEGPNLVTIACGANMNFDRLRFVAERAELGEQREAVFAVTIPERPGSFREFCRLLGQRNITEFNYRYADPTEAHVFVGIEVARPRARRTSCCASLERAGIEDARPHRQRDGEAARPPPGRRPRARRRERDPLPLRVSRAARRADALPRQHERTDWNISLFHYRNHGADYGRVLVGMQVPPADRRRVPRLAAPARLPVRRRDAQSRIRAVLVAQRRIR